MEPPILPPLNLPISTFFLDVLKNQSHSKQKFTALPLHFLGPNAVVSDLAFKKQIALLQRAIQASDRRANFFGRAIHAVTCNDLREFSRVLVSYDDAFGNQAQVNLDQHLRENKLDRGIQVQELKQSLVYKFSTMKMELNEQCRAPGCFCVFREQNAMDAHVEIHCNTDSFRYRCHFCFEEIYSKEGSAGELFQDIYFHTLFDFLMHVQEHRQFLRGTRERETQCPLCDFRTFDKGQAALHGEDHLPSDKNDQAKLFKKLNIKK
ncbi:hypothetical protein SS50377_24403 [Spironucleus salmonicida]|uniref:C2H2-type domain-containing protein n=1 Tax=Spironucleus salmonicida TaxID=348837 RepID=V6LMY3_9EUKA|nr:hypothetical protein SS50377_24403 [Spironucleus salmonicida]|eukprot:EST46047.1 hypothetical protein SS50377_14037 [Spironucleus salmonicida]